MSAAEIRFLSLQNVLDIHTDTLAHEGGADGVRDLGLLASAVEMPQASFDGQYLHNGLAEMAAAYLFHVCQNHAFVDGNKRTAAFASVSNEGSGVADNVAAKADARITIPCPGPVESLNAAVAASVLLYEAARQRGVQALGSHRSHPPRRTRRMGQPESESRSGR